MPYRGNPSTDSADALRLLIGDLSTSTGNEIFSDAEIDYFNAARANVYSSAALAISSILGSTRGQDLGSIVRKRVGDLEIEYGGGSEGGQGFLKAKVRSLKSQAAMNVKPFAGGISESANDTAYADTDWAEPSFRRGMSDHPGIGTLSTST